MATRDNSRCPRVLERGPWRIPSSPGRSGPDARQPVRYGWAVRCGWPIPVYDFLVHKTCPFDTGAVS